MSVLDNHYEQKYAKKEKIIHLDRQKNQRIPDGQSNQKKAHSLRGVAKVLFYIGLLVVLSLFVVPLYKTYEQSQLAQQHYEQALSDNQKAIERYQAVSNEFQLLQNPEYLAEIARRDYYYSKPNEIIFDLGDSNQTNHSIFNESIPE